MSGRKVAPWNLNDPLTRLAAIGTVGQNFRYGTAHLWGTGVDASMRAFGRRNASFAAAPNTSYVVHATRGPNSRGVLLDAGIHAPPIYGDGAWFLPRLVKGNVEKKYELGVILHISELDSVKMQAKPKNPRHRGGEADGVHFISTCHESSLGGFKAKLNEILTCKRIVSSSFHGMLIADAYKIPCLYFSARNQGPARINASAGPDELDHRFADFYQGTDRDHVPSYGQPTSEATPWDRVIRAVDQLWTPTDHLRSEVFFEAFPFRPCVSFSDATWPVKDALFEGLKW